MARVLVLGVGFAGERSAAGCRQPVDIQWAYSPAGSAGLPLTNAGHLRHGA